MIWSHGVISVTLSKGLLHKWNRSAYVCTCALQNLLPATRNKWECSVTARWADNVFANVWETRIQATVPASVTFFYWMKKLIKWANGGWKDRQMEEKSGRTEGWLLTGHLTQACFSLGEGRRKEEIAGISTWPSTCLTAQTQMHRNKSLTNMCTCTTEQPHTYANMHCFCGNRFLESWGKTC